MKAQANKSQGKDTRWLVSHCNHRAFWKFKVLLIYGLIISLASVCIPAENITTQTQTSPSGLEKILSDPVLWGKDLPLAVVYLGSWKRIGEHTVLVFPDKVVSSTPFKTRKEAQRAGERLTQALRESRPALKPEFANLLRGFPEARPPFKTEAIFFPDDDSVRVALSGPALQFLKPALKLEEVRSRLGPPEKVSRHLVQNETERRPVVLTLYTYASGAVIFVESDVAPRPGFVNRVILDVSAVTSAVFLAAK
jgi:hypothetical protein